MKVLILYGTTEGQTRKVAQYLAEQSAQHGHIVSLYEANDNPPDVEGFEVVIVCASVHVGRYQSGVAHYVKHHAAKLNAIKTAFVSVSLTAASEDEASWIDLNHITETFLHYVGWNPSLVEQVAGALRYTQYDFFKKFTLRMIARRAGGSTDTSHDTEYTDWKQVNEILTKLKI